MSSTDDDRLRRFYVDRLEPAARRLRERGVAFFPLGPDAGAASRSRAGRRRVAELRILDISESPF